MNKMIIKIVCIITVVQSQVLFSMENDLISSNLANLFQNGHILLTDSKLLPLANSMLEMKADINFKFTAPNDALEYIPLTYLLKFRKVELEKTISGNTSTVVQWLVNNKADVNFTNSSNTTPLFIACQTHCALSIVKQLTNAGAEVFSDPQLCVSVMKTSSMPIIGYFLELQKEQKEKEATRTK